MWCIIPRVYSGTQPHKEGGKAVEDTLGDRLRVCRAKLRMSQEQLSEASGVSRQTIAKIETGAIKSSTSATIIKLAKALDVPLDSLFLV